jgi:hypothetical protein
MIKLLGKKQVIIIYINLMDLTQQRDMKLCQATSRYAHNDNGAITNRS